MKNEAQIMESVLEELNNVEKREIKENKVTDKKTLRSNIFSGSRGNIVSAGKFKNNYLPYPVCSSTVFYKFFHRCLHLS